jgi:hypothetical protein
MLLWGLAILAAFILGKRNSHFLVAHENVWF